nr:CPBP family intramembrane metalloprotease [Clostridia bacterium]
MSKMRKALLVVLTLALIKLPLDKLLAAVLPDVSVDAAPQLLATAAVTLLLMGVPALLLRPWTSPRLVRTEKRWTCLLLAVITAVLTRAALTPVDAAWQNALGLAAQTMPLPESAGETALYIVALALIPAVAEELFYRGSLLTGLLDGSRRGTAVLLTTAMFALMHGSLANLPGLLVISLLLTLLMLHSGSVAAPLAAHFFYNICALIWGSVPLWGSILSGAGLIALTGCIILRQPKLVHPPMKRADGLIAAAALAVLAAQYFV